VIDKNKCIRCGQCIHSCPFGAIGSKAAIVDVINAIKSGKEVWAMAAPATEGQFGEGITMQSFREASLKLGFAGFIEAGLGGDLTTSSEAEEWLEAYKNGEKKTTSCCPGFVNMIRQHYPELAGHISTTVSPMCGVSRLVKAQHPGALTVFIGPCVAKKSEVVDQQIKDNADFVLTYSELRAIMRAANVPLEPQPNTYQEASVYGKRYGNAGGVTASVLEYMKETNQECDAKVCTVNGAADCKKALLLMKVGKLPEDFIEGMACEGGCVGGPSRFEEIISAKKNRDLLIAEADERTIVDNLKNYPLDSFSMHRE
jgi:ferredoxin hydrogenase large subunit